MAAKMEDSGWLRAAVLGAISAHLSGAPVAKGVWRVTFWSALALGVTAGVGAMFGVAA
jgi:VIT1/CCC1 family predicted Fe2+/Mn2+ transporter